MTVVVRVRTLGLLDKCAASEFVSRRHFYFLSVVSLSLQKMKDADIRIESL